MSNNIINYQCDKYLDDFCSKDTVETLMSMLYLTKEYESFVEEIESFFNNNLEDGEIENFKGNIFELSDNLGLINFPFTIENKKLKIIESEAWKSLIISAIVQKNTNRRKRDEKLPRTKLQYLPS